jgi:hypothetical protein
MLREKAIRVRVERMLSGDVNPCDVASTFADLRFLKKCPPEARDLPDFAAHRPDRDRGHTLEATNKLLTNMEAHLSGRLPKWTASSGYSDVGVVKALKSYLILRNIFKPDELTGISTLTRPIALYGIASMHGCVLQRRDVPFATLAIRMADPQSSDLLDIACTAQMPRVPGFQHPQHSQIKVNLCVFSTSVGADAAIGRLRSDLASSSAFSVDYTTSLEVTSDGELQYLE